MMRCIVCYRIRMRNKRRFSPAPMIQQFYRIGEKLLRSIRFTAWALPDNWTIGVRWELRFENVQTGWIPLRWRHPNPTSRSFFKSTFFENSVNQYCFLECTSWLLQLWVCAAKLFLRVGLPLECYLLYIIGPASWLLFLRLRLPLVCYF